MCKILCLTTSYVLFHGCISDFVALNVLIKNQTKKTQNYYKDNGSGNIKFLLGERILHLY